MSMLEGVSQCWPLAKDCVVWWDAWAAIGALAGAWVALIAVAVSLLTVLSTVFLGIMTLNLGRAANQASETAVEISRVDFERQRYRDETERLLVLVQIAGEIATGHDWIVAEIERLASGDSRRSFAESANYRSNVFRRLAGLQFPISESVTDRLHYLDRGVSSKLLRSTNMLKMLQAYGHTWGSPGSVVKLDDAHGVLAVTLHIVKCDLGDVRSACQAAVQDAGIAVPNIAEDYEKFRERVNS